MRKKVIVLLSVLIVLGISSSMVYADTGYFFSEHRHRGVGSSYVAFDEEHNYYTVGAPTKSTSGGYYYVTLKNISYTIPGVPYTFTTAIGKNDVIFRPYTDAQLSATNNTINFKYATADGLGEFRKSTSYGSPSYSESGHQYYLMCSLNSTSSTNLFNFSGRFTP